MSAILLVIRDDWLWFFTWNRHQYCRRNVELLCCDCDPVRTKCFETGHTQHYRLIDVEQITGILPGIVPFFFGQQKKPGYDKKETKQRDQHQYLPQQMSSPPQSPAKPETRRMPPRFDALQLHFGKYRCQYILFIAMVPGVKPYRSQPLTFQMDE